MSDRARAALLLGISLLIYANTLTSGFVYDDEMYVRRNIAVTHPTLTLLFKVDKYANVFRPVTFATLAMNWVTGHEHTFGYHLVNVLLNAAVPLLLYFLLLSLLDSVPRGRTIAFVAALLYAVHPIHTEAVAWISGRSEVLAAGFLLAAWLLHLKDKPLPALLCFLLAMMSKESAIAFIPLALVGDYARGKLKPASRYAWFAGMGVLYLALLWNAQGGRFGEKGFSPIDNPLASFPVKWRILNALRVAWKYIGLHVYPAKLSCDYSYNAILLFANWKRTLPAAVATAVVLALWIWAVRRRTCGWTLAGAIYLAPFAVTANILVSTGTLMGERLAYLPSAGFCLLVALIWVQLEQRRARLARGVLIAVLIALATRTVVRNRDWRNDWTLFSAAVRAYPQNAKMRANLGGLYLQRGQLDEAEAELNKALQIFPDFPEALELKGLVEARKNQDQEALELFVKALSKVHRDYIHHDVMAVNLAAQLIKLGRNEDALKVLNETIEEAPEISRAWSNRAVIRYQQGEVAPARSDAEEALRLDPTNNQAQALLSDLNAPHGSPSTP
jgi:protein O-mannosyl-transferase